MGEFELIFFVAIAGFFAYKIWSVLGKTNGDEQSRAAEIVAIAKAKPAEDKKPKLQALQESKIIQLFEEEIPKEFANDVAKIKKIDASFTLETFLKGASRAFETVIESYSAAKHDRLKFLLNDEVYADFASDIKNYEDKSQKAKVTLVSLDDPELVSVDLKGSVAQITLEFASEQINFVEDDKGEVVDGSKSRIEKAKDLWVFERDLKSHKPQWLIVSTDA